jgi:HSP20 family protein
MTTVNRWNPVRDMITLREAMDQMFDENFRSRMGTGAMAWALPVDAYVTDDAIILKADVPGLKSEDLEVTLEGDTLTIRGEVKRTTEERKYLLRERAFGKFERTMTINTPIDHSKVEAGFEDGVLTLTLPKAEAVKPRQIAIKTPSLAKIPSLASKN